MGVATLAIDGGLISLPEAATGRVRCFKGIPYAAPPVGPLRWRAPRPLQPWTGIRPTGEFGMNALQVQVFADIDPSKPGVSEDCLYLNVWTPGQLDGSERLPVMFWIHGGGFAAGHGAEPRYDGSRLAARGIIVITVNYRLGAFGFLAHPALTAENPHKASGNWGLHDLIAALHWTQRNIAAFGGDPAAVTIAGESAGSSAVSALMASPLAKGLFARAIGQSGAFFSALARKLDARAEAERAGAGLAERLGVNAADDLRKLPADVILAAAPGVGFRPIIDGHLLPAPPARIFAARRHSDVPMLAGWNKDEGFNLGLVGTSPEQSYEEIVLGMFGAAAADVLRMYPAGDAAQSKASARALGGDARIIYATWAWIEAQKAHGTADIYRFRFERAPLTAEGWFGDKPSRDAGAFHSGEIPYVFDTLDALPWLIDDADPEIARVASGWWVNFVKYGNPNGQGVPAWPSYREPGAPIMHIDRDPSARPADDNAHRRLAGLADPA